MSNAMPPERAVRLLRAKVGELENAVLIRRDAGDDSDGVWLAADIALIATLLADHIEQSQTPDDSMAQHVAGFPVDAMVEVAKEALRTKDDDWRRRQGPDGISGPDGIQTP